MVFTEPVFIEDNNILIPAGIPLRQKDLDKLNAWGVETVLTNGSARAGNDTSQKRDSYSSVLGPVKLPASVTGAVNKPNSMLSLTEVQENKGAYRAYTMIIEQLNSFFISIASKVPVDTRPIDDICSRLLQGVRDQRENYIGFILGGEVKGYEMAKSSANTAILSALIARELKLPHHKIMQVVTGALLHDAGMLRLPKEILDKRGGLSEAERLQMKNHPLLAHRIVSKELPYPDEVGLIVLQHHERWDGEGYPRGIAGASIYLGARIVSVADAFEAMVSHKPYRNPMVGYQAMKNLLADNKQRFDPDVLKAFVLTMGIYPIGSIVRLNNNALARVIEARGDAPLRPKLRVLIDEFNQVFRNETGNIIDLLIEKNLFITKALDAKEISEKYT